MFDSLIDRELKTRMQFQAKYIAIVVRNAMEEFHSKYLSDEQMRELNPIIRNAVYTALYTNRYYKDSINIRAFVDQHVAMIPMGSISWTYPFLSTENICSFHY